jgi:hypothetical protein
VFDYERHGADLSPYLAQPNGNYMTTDLEMAFVAIAVTAFMIIGFPMIMKHCGEDGIEQSCGVEYVITLTGKLEPVMKCHPLDGGTKQTDANP